MQLSRISGTTISATEFPSLHPIKSALLQVNAQHDIFWIVGLVANESPNWCCRAYNGKGNYTYLDQHNKQFVTDATVPTRELMDKCNLVTDDVIHVTHSMYCSDRHRNILLVRQQSHYDQIVNIIDADKPAPDNTNYNAYIADMTKFHIDRVTKLTAEYDARVAELVVKHNAELTASKTRVTELVEAITKLVENY